VTRAQLVSHWNMSASDEIDLDDFIEAANAMSAAERFKYALEVQHVLSLIEEGDATGYNTPAAIRSRLGFV
jgi:hypothetical protein